MYVAPGVLVTPVLLPNIVHVTWHIPNLLQTLHLAELGKVSHRSCTSFALAWLGAAREGMWSHYLVSVQ